MHSRYVLLIIIVVPQTSGAREIENIIIFVSHPVDKQIPNLSISTMTMIKSVIVCATAIINNNKRNKCDG